MLPGATRTLVADVRPAVPTQLAPPAGGATPCSALVAHSVMLARSGQIDEAERGLLKRKRCVRREAEPGSSSVACDSSSAATTSGNAGQDRARGEPADETAWELLATSRYLQGDLLGALEAWNQIGRPRTDVVRIKASSGSITRSSSGAPPRAAPADYAVRLCAGRAAARRPADYQGGRAQLPPSR